MLLVAIVTMSTSLLILILERTNTIGILKALGMRDVPIRSMFLWIAARILLAGLVWGNVVALGLLGLQRWFGFLTLDEKNYYVRVVPVEFNFYNILIINILCIAFTMLVLILPSMIITKITPVKAIRFG
jgi:lipoprotein-releasing system permease protein